MPYRLSESILAEVVDLLPEVFDSHEFERKAFQVFRDQFMDDSTITSPQHINQVTELLENRLATLAMVQPDLDEQGQQRCAESENFLGDVSTCLVWRKVERPREPESPQAEVAGS